MDVQILNPTRMLLNFTQQLHPHSTKLMHNRQTHVDRANHND